MYAYICTYIIYHIYTYIYILHEICRLLLYYYIITSKVVTHWVDYVIVSERGKDVWSNIRRMLLQWLKTIKAWHKVIALKTNLMKLL